MSSTSLRPLLRPSTLPSLPSPSTRTTYICQSCRHARLLRRPKRPYTFTQLLTLSDGSAITLRTTSPTPVYRSTRDTRNAPLWNPSSKELLNVEDDEAGRLAGFRARFGKGFDAQRQLEEESTADDASKGINVNVDTGAAQSSPFFAEATETKYPGRETGSTQGQAAQAEEDEYYEFAEDDANLLDLISSYGREVSGPKAPAPSAPAGKKGKK